MKHLSHDSDDKLYFALTYDLTEKEFTEKLLNTETIFIAKYIEDWHYYWTKWMAAEFKQEGHFRWQERILLLKKCLPLDSWIFILPQVKSETASLVAEILRNAP